MQLSNMKKEEIIILDDRGLISITGDDAKEYLQNIITNDIEKVDQSNSIFSALLSPQGKYLHEFFIISTDNGYYLDCSTKSKEDLIKQLSKYKLRSKVEIKDFSTDFVIGVISSEKFKEIKSEDKKLTDTILYRESPTFIDPRKKGLGARMLSSLEKLHLTIKKLNLKIIDSSIYFELAHNLAMQIAATNPISLDKDSVSIDVVAKEKEIYTDQAKSSGKPDNIIEKMVEGRLSKFYQENCLMEQAYIKDSDKKVVDLMTETIATLGENITISQFTRFAVGESNPQN